MYLLMTVLRGDLAVKQSRALVMAFKAMKDYIADTRGLVTQRDLLRLSMQTTENTEAIRSIHTMLENQQKSQNLMPLYLMRIQDRLQVKGIPIRQDQPRKEAKNRMMR